MSKDHDVLPLPDYDHVPTGHLPARIEPLDEQQLGELLEYEREHAQRLPVLIVLEHRLEQLRGGATPSGTGSAERPETMGAAPRAIEGVARDLGAAHQPAFPGRADEPRPATLKHERVCSDR